MSNVVEFKKKMKEVLPPDERYVCFVVNTDGSGAFVEHHEKLNPYEVLGMIEVAKAIILAGLDVEEE